MIQNLDGKVASGSGVVHRSVADGEYVVGLTWEDPAASWVRDGAPVKIVYPVEGVVFMNSTTAKVKGGPNSENAQKFIDFTISEEAQTALGTHQPSPQGRNSTGRPHVPHGRDESYL